MSLLEGIKPAGSTKTSGSGLLSGIIPQNNRPTTTPVSAINAPTPTEPKYFAAVDKTGSYGFSDIKDLSGKPLFAYRNPGDQSTTTDYTRVATTFDPRTPTPLDRSHLVNGRMPESISSMLRKELGAGYSEDLDHKISLELSGSNQRENLQLVSRQLNQGKYADKENQLARDVVAGKISLFDAQVADAKQKGIKTPFVGKKPSFLDNVVETVKKAAGAVQNFIAPKAEAKTIPSTGEPNSGLMAGITPLSTPSIPRAPVEPGINLTRQNNLTANSTPQILDKNSKGLGDFVLNPNAEIPYPRVPFTSAKEQKSLGTLKGPRIITLPASFLNGVVAAFAEAPVRLGADIAGETRNLQGKETKLPFDPTRIGLPASEGNKYTPIFDENLTRLNQLDTERPNTPNLNLAQSFFETTFNRAIVDPIVTGDIAKILSAKMLSLSKSSPELGLSSTQIKNLTPEDAVNEVGKRFFERAQQIMTSNVDDAGKLTKVGQQQIAKLITETKSLGQAFSDGTIPQLNPLGRFLDNISVRLNQDVLNLGRPLSLTTSKINPADETLPGYVPMSGQPVGATVSPQQPVGFGYDDASKNISNKFKDLKDYDDAIKAGEMKATDLYKDPAKKILQPEEAQKIVFDVKTDLERFKPGLGTSLDKAVDVQNTTAEGIHTAAQKILGPKTETFTGFKDLSTTVLEKLKGRSTVSHQFISDLTNAPELKQVERDVIRMVLEKYPSTAVIPVKQFAEEVKTELLPLKRSLVGDTENGGSRYETVSLPDALKGPVQNYSEHIYNSPIPTMAGDVHFNTSTSGNNYFGHVRVEDLPGDTRRVIEVQSDLYQKGNLDNSIKNNKDYLDFVKTTEPKPGMAAERVTSTKKAQDLLAGAKKLQQYNDPTAHFRMVREEIKQAAIDGKTKLQFPTGETAMKIEGLGNPQTFRIETGQDNINANPRLTPETIKVGQKIFRDYNDQFIVTADLGDGKFKAIPQKVFDLISERVDKGLLRGDPLNIARNNYAETFDISGKVDTNNPIYKFYEKDLGRYLNRFGAKKITDPQGVSWYEIPVPKEAAKNPVMAYSRKNIFSRIGGPKMTLEKAKETVFKNIPKDQVGLIFQKDLIDGIATGQYKSVRDGLQGVLKPLITLYEEGGKVGARAVYEEVGHHIFDQLTSSQKQSALMLARNIISPIEKAKLKIAGYSEKDILEEWIVKKWAKDTAANDGYTGPLKKIFQLMKDVVNKIIDVYKKIKTRTEKILEEQGSQRGMIKNPLVPSENRPIQKSLIEAQKIFDEFSSMKQGELIQNPNTLVPVQIPVADPIKEFAGIKNDDVSFTRLSIKHLAEKGEKGNELLKNIPEIITSPDEIYQGPKKDRFYISKEISIGKRPKQVVVLEVTKNAGGIVVTSFPTNNQFLKNFELLWRTPPVSKNEFPPSSLPKKGIFAAGDEFSARTATQNVQDQNSASGRAPKDSKNPVSSIERSPQRSTAARLPDFQEQSFNINKSRQQSDTTLPDTSARVNVRQNPVETRINELEIERSAMEESLVNDPAKALAKYANKNRELPEVLGRMRSNFGTKGDDIVTELGFKNTEEARLAYDNYKLKLKRLDNLKESIKTIKEIRAKGILEDKDAKSLKFFLDKQAKISSEEIGAVVNNTKKRKGRVGEFQRRLKEDQKTRSDYLETILSKLQQLESPVARETSQGSLEALDSSQPISLEDHERLNGNNSYKSIILDTNTPVKYKVALHDYFRTPDRVLKKIGLGSFNKPLRFAYESYLAELPDHMELIKHWESRVPGTDASKRIFRYLDGQMNRDYFSNKTVERLSEKELQVAEEIKTYLQEWAQRLGLPQDNQITHYITHIFDLGYNEKEFSEDIARLIRDKVAGSVYDPFLEKRLGKKGYIEDTWKALEAYSKRAVRKANMDPILERIKPVASRLEDSQKRFIKRLVDKINLRPTELENLLDNTIKYFAGYRLGGRPTALLSRLGRKIVYQATLGLNISSAIKNLTQGVNTFATLGPKYTGIGYAKLITQGAQELEDVGLLSQDIIQDRTITATKKTLEKMDKALFTLFELAEKINRGSAYYGAKSKAIAEGATEMEAVEYAKKLVRDTQFQFGSIDTPVALNDNISKLFGQFLSFGFKQTEFAAEMLKNKKWAAIIRYIVGSLAIVYTFGKAFNIKGQDFIPGYSLASRINNNSLVPPALALPWEIVKAVTNFPDRYGKSRDTAQKAEDVVKAIPYPGKVQIEKTFKGVRDYMDPEKDVAKSPLTATKAAIFGNKNLPPANPELQKAKSEETAARKQSSTNAQSEYTRIKSSSDPKGEWEKLNQVDPTLAKKVADIATKEKLNLTPRDKGLLFLGVTNGRRAKAIYELFQKLSTNEEKKALWEELAAKKVITDAVGKQLLELLKTK